MELSSHVLEPRRELNLRLLVESIPAPVAVMTPSGEVEAVNKPNLEYFGKTFEDLKKWGTSDAVHPDDLPHAIEIWMEAIQTGQPYDVKQRLRRFDGVYRWFEVRGFPLRDPDGRILNWCVLLTDIDDRHRTEEALRASEAYSAEAQRLSHTGSWHWNVNTGEVAWSQSYCAIFGFDFEKDKPSYQLFIERVHPEDRPKVEQVLLADVREKRDFDGEYRLLLPDGSIKYLHSLGKCSVSQSGDVEYIGAVVDITEHKRAEQELRDSEERHRVVVEAASDAVISMDENGGIQLANAAALRVFGYDRAELIGKPLTLLMPEYMRKLHEKGFKAYLATGERHINWQGTELTGLRKNGQEFPVEISFGELVKDGHRIFTGFIRDISERRRAEEALRRSEAHLSQAQRLAHVGSWVWQVDGRKTVYLSEEWYRVYGFDPTGGMPTWEERLQRVHPEDRATWQAAIDRAIDKKSDYELEFRILLPDREVRYIHSVGHPVFGSSGELVQFVGVSMDVTQSRQAEQAFRLLVVGTAATLGSDFFQSLVQHMAQALRARYAFVTTCDDQKHARTLAFWKGDRFGENFDFDIADTPCEKVLHGEVCRCRQGLQGLFPRDKFLADWQAESYLGVPMLDRSNRVIGHLAILDDKPMEADSRAIDLLKIFASRAAAELNRQKAEDELQAALQERERMREELAHLAHLNRVSTMGELAASLAHEIKQPISAAMTDARTCSRWLTRDCPDLAEAQAAASRVVKDVTRASEIIGRVRSLFKKDSLQHEEVDINEVIQEMIALLQGEASRHSILIHRDCSLDLPPIMADRVQLQQVLMNLMLNSIEAMKGMNTPGRLTIKSHQDDSGQLLISVMDTGVGVPAEKMDQIFNPFFTSKSEGTGMGLPISRSIIESHGGRLWAVSNPESGSIFNFTLPIEHTAHQAA
jgi:PAS domain S-box-containing protein